MSTKDTVIGSYTGTGAAINISLGFVPDHVRVINTTDRDAGWNWFKGMPDGSAVAEGAALATLAANGISEYPGSDTESRGFTIGTALSEASDTFHYIAQRSSE